MATTRAHLGLVVLDTAGNIQPSKALTITKPDGSALGQTLYDASTGGSVVTTPTTDLAGRLDVFVDIPARALLTPAGGTARLEELFPDPQDLFIQGDTIARRLDGYTGTDPVLTIAINNAAGSGLRVENTDDDAVFEIKQTSSGGVAIVGDDGTTPTTTRLYVTTPGIVASNVAAQRISAIVGAAGLTGVSALDVAISQTIGGTASAHGGLTVTATKGASATAGTWYGAKIVVSSAVASASAKQHTGLWITSTGAQDIDTALLIDGSGGYADFLRGYTAADALAFQVTAAGAAAFGATAATAGTIRLPTSALIAARNAANGNNISLLQTDASDNILIGNQVTAASIFALASAGINLQVGANTELQATTGGIIVGRAASTLGCFGASGAVKGTVTGSRGANAALASLLTLLASYGLLTDSSS